VAPFQLAVLLLQAVLHHQLAACADQGQTASSSVTHMHS
jgi:hypothetical protein